LRCWWLLFELASSESTISKSCCISRSSHREWKSPNVVSRLRVLTTYIEYGYRQTACRSMQASCRSDRFGEVSTSRLKKHHRFFLHSCHHTVSPMPKCRRIEASLSDFPTEISTQLPFHSFYQVHINNGSAHRVWEGVRRCVLLLELRMDRERVLGHMAVMDRSL